MVGNFNLIRTPGIIFGAGRAERMGELIQPSRRNLLVITGSKSHESNDSYLRCVDSLRKTGCEICFERIANEPSPSEIDLIARKEIYRNTDVVIAVGGGSVIDAGKAVSAMIPVTGSITEYLEGVGNRKPTGEKIHFIALPTTAGTGSEATANAVITNVGAEGFKRSLRHENYVPDIALIDPVFTFPCPPDITASSGMDAFTQLLESYVSVKSNPVTDALALEGIHQIHNCLVNAVNDGSNIEARSGMSYAALMSGITLANAGLGLVHGFASAIGGFFRIPHGVVCGTLMGVVNRFNIDTLLSQDELTITHHKYARVGEMLSQKPGKDLKWYMKYTADYIDDLTEKLKINRLGKYGITREFTGKIAANSDHKANPVKFEQDSLVQMLNSRI